MDFRSLTVKELFDNPRTAAVVKVGIVPLDQAKKIEAKVNELIK